jgi:hypothetical protein
VEKMSASALTAPRDLADVSAIEEDARQAASSEVARARA